MTNKQIADVLAAKFKHNECVIDISVIDDAIRVCVACKDQVDTVTDMFNWLDELDLKPVNNVFFLGEFRFEVEDGFAPEMCDIWYGTEERSVRWRFDVEQK